jgi:uncharacterized iron-regulated membrane protein
MPVSATEHAGHGAGGAGADAAAITGADAIAARAAAHGLTGGYRLYLPSGPTGVYTALRSPDDPEGQRTLIFDRWSGALIGENGWRDYGVGAKAVELGVQIHMGRYFGLANQLLMLVPCIGIIVLVVTGTTMWWRRRPRGSLGAPPPISGARVTGAIGGLLVAGLVLPLFGASLLLLTLGETVLRLQPKPLPQRR